MQLIEIDKTNPQKLVEISDHNGEDILIIGNEGGYLHLNLNLSSANCNQHVYALIVGRNDQEYNLTINSYHNVEYTNSRVHVKAVMMDSSKLNFNGMIKISPIAQKTDAYLQNDNLLIGENAVINSSPQLEIAADDVKASHGVTITNIEETEKFYLMARGLSEQQAEKLVIYGFVNEFIELIENSENKEIYKAKLLG